MIAKFLGHKSIQTTDTFYLKMSFEEVFSRMTVPWLSREPKQSNAF